VVAGRRCFLAYPVKIASEAAMTHQQLYQVVRQPSIFPLGSQFNVGYEFMCPPHCDI
jgi:hypothetical protein